MLREICPPNEHMLTPGEMMSQTPGGNQMMIDPISLAEDTYN